jgi:hypothetical protein
VATASGLSATSGRRRLQAVGTPALVGVSQSKQDPSLPPPLTDRPFQCVCATGVGVNIERAAMVCPARLGWQTGIPPAARLPK